MQLQALSGRYRIRRLTGRDLDQILAVCAGNELFYRHHPPMATPASIRQDMAALPPGRTAADKYYLGFFAPDEPDGLCAGAGRPERLAAVLDLVLGWPQPDTAFIGFFMVAGPLQGRGAGSAMVTECLARLAALGFARARLAVDEGNPQSAAFWQKNGFVFTGQRTPRDGGAYLPMERALPGRAGNAAAGGQNG